MKLLRRDKFEKYKRYGIGLIADLTGIYIREDLDFKIIMYSTVPTVESKTKLGFNPYDLIMRKNNQ